jgi:integrase/recombinase XerD
MIERTMNGHLIQSDPSLPSQVERNTNEKWMYLFLSQKNRGSKKTGETYERELRRFFSFLNNKSLDQVTLEDLNAFVDSLAAQGLSIRTQRRIVTIIRSFFKFLAKDGVNALKINVAAALELPKQENDSETGIERVLLKNEVEQLLSVARADSYKNYVLLLFLLTTGVRVSELCAANWGDLFLDNYGNIGLRVHGKGNKLRNVKILPYMWTHLCEYRNMKGLPVDLDPKDLSPLFTNKFGERMTPRNIQKLIKRLGKKAGIKKEITPHWLRHTHATLALMGGADVEQVRRQLGHASLNLIPLYVHNVEGLRNTAADKIDLDIL